MAEQRKESKGKATPQPRPSLDQLLVHPILKADNEGGQYDEQSYPDWQLDHRHAARFYVGGFYTLRSITRRTDAKYYYLFAQDAIEIAREEGWDEQMDGFTRPASYNQFRNVISLSRPMFFENAAQVIVSCELALADAIQRGRYYGNKTDIYKMMKIIPATYNIDAFNESALERLRSEIDNFNSTVLAYAGQRSRHLLDHMSQGYCVTRRTARQIHLKTLEILKSNPSIENYIGDVRGRPGKKRLGRKSATTSEDVELNNLELHQNRERSF